MKTDKTSHSLNTFSFLSEEVERTLRLRAWKDEIFREALIADPKGVIQRLFPQYFSNGKLAEQLTIKVIEEEPDTCHIVLPFLPDEVPTFEIPEEEHLELLANMGADRKLGRTDSFEQRESQSPEKPKVVDHVRRQAEEAAKKQETASKPLTRENLQKDIKSLAKKDDKFFEKLKEVSNETSQEKKEEKLGNIIKEYFPHYLNGSNAPERQTFEVLQNTADTHHFVLQKLPDASHNPAVPEVKLDLKSNSEACSRGTFCEGPCK
jgi:hypothetical protein